jgi:hypothetical protein
MAKKVSACRVEVQVIYHCEFSKKCDFYVRTGLMWHCDYMNLDDCTLRAAQRAGRRQSRRRA